MKHDVVPVVGKLSVLLLKEQQYSVQENVMESGVIFKLNTLRDYSERRRVKRNVLKQ